MHILQEWLVDEVKRGGYWAKLPKKLRKRFQYTGPVYCGEREEDLPMPNRKASEHTAAELIEKYESQYVDFEINRETAREFWWDEVGYLLFLCCETIKSTKFTPMDDQQQHYGDISGPNLESNCQQKWRRLVSNVDKMMRLRAGLMDFDRAYGVTNEIKSHTFAIGKNYPTLESSACTVAEAAFKLAKELSRIVQSCCLENSFRSLLSLSIRLADKPHNMVKLWAASLESESMFVDGLLPEPEPDSIPVDTTNKREQKQPEQPVIKVKRADIAKTLLTHMKAGERFVSYPHYVKLHKWKSTSTVYNAVRDNPELHGWAGWTEDGKSVAAKQFGETYAESNEQHTEDDPSLGGHTSDELEAAYTEVMEKASEDRQAILRQKTLEERRRIAATAIEKGWVDGIPKKKKHPR